MPTVAAGPDDVVAVLEAGRGVEFLEGGGGRHDLLDHGLQAAALLAAWRPGDDELAVAGLVHDIGHVLAPGLDDAHGEVAAAFVAPVLGRRVAALVRLHVPAKRYAVTRDPTYRARLAPDSIASLALQGGDMDGAELAAFEAEPHGADALVLRRADEGAKEPDRSVPGLGHWLGSLRAVAAGAKMAAPGPPGRN